MSPEMREFLGKEKEIDEKMDRIGNDYDQMLNILNEKNALYRQYDSLITDKEEHYIFLDKHRDIRMANHCSRNLASSTLVSIGGLTRRSKPAFA
jgi:hypothetical protein